MELTPLWHSFLKMLVNSVPMKGTKPGGRDGEEEKQKKKGTKPPNFVLPTQKD